MLKCSRQRRRCIGRRVIHKKRTVSTQRHGCNARGMLHPFALSSPFLGCRNHGGVGTVVPPAWAKFNISPCGIVYIKINLNHSCPDNFGTAPAIVGLTNIILRPWRQILTTIRVHVILPHLANDLWPLQAPTSNNAIS